ncbi:hypothetical protein ID866_11032 [Astraeus odoratus]|nr:hypothetical protein ID866_11032 [Astraeus odoratus]
MIFDSRVRTLHDFGSAPINTISFNPQARLVLLAGFGNLAGKIDIVDRRTLGKIATIEAPNTSYCAWSPCGRFLLTAVLSPRLWPVDELYQAGWRPTPVDQAPAFGQTLPPAPQAAPSVASATVNSKSPSAKPAGTYCHLGARGLPTPVMFRQKHEGGTPMVAEIATPPRGYSGPNPSKGLY